VGSSPKVARLPDMFRLDAPPGAGLYFPRTLDHRSLGLPNTKSAAKQMRVQERRRLRNKAVRSATRTSLKRAEREIASGDSNPTADVVRQAISALDRAAKKGVIHPNNAARHKSRLMKKVNSQAATTGA
jgi:small subunit ribosomal protein S20